MYGRTNVLEARQIYDHNELNVLKEGTISGHTNIKEKTNILKKKLHTSY